MLPPNEVFLPNTRVEAYIDKIVGVMNRHAAHYRFARDSSSYYLVDYTLELVDAPVL